MVAIEEAGAEKLHEEIMANTALEGWLSKLPQILQRLSEDELTIIELRFFERHSFREIGDILGITEVYAKVRTYRILDKMRDLFLKTS